VFANTYTDLTTRCTSSDVGVARDAFWKLDLGSDKRYLEILQGAIVEHTVQQLRAAPWVLSLAPFYTRA
jgi:hypothetical protein